MKIVLVAILVLVCGASLVGATQPAALRATQQPRATLVPEEEPTPDTRPEPTPDPRDYTPVPAYPAPAPSYPAPPREHQGDSLTNGLRAIWHAVLDAAPVVR
jgi:hypothetical protein